MVLPRTCTAPPPRSAGHKDDTNSINLYPSSILDECLNTFAIMSVCHPLLEFCRSYIYLKGASRLEICQKIYRTEDFRVKNLHRKRVIFDIC